jgi:hypothetical protein
MASSFANKKQLKFVITLQTGTFGSSNSNTITLEGFRSEANINKAGGMMMGELRAQIWGVSQSDMNSCTTLQWQPKSLNQNTVQVYAIDGAQSTLVFQGNIVNAWGVYDNMPDVYLMIQAQSAYFNQLQPVAPTSLQGSVDVATLMGQLASNMGYTFENNGVSVQLSNPYLPNTGMEQAKALAQAAGVDLYLDDNVLAITLQNQPRSMSTIPQISATSGLTKYPTFDGVGVSFEMLFNPAVKFGGSISLLTSVKAVSNVSSQWIVTSLAYNLEGEKYNGKWFTRVRGNLSGLAISN